MSSNQRPHISSLTSILRAADAPQAMPSIENHRVNPSIEEQFGGAPSGRISALRAISVNAALEALALDGQNRISGAQAGAVELIARTLASLSAVPPASSPAPGVVVPLEQIEAATHALMAAGTGNGSAPAESPGTGGNGE